MQHENIYIQQIIDKLKELNPYLVILFGSYAYGSPNQDSDIDLIVVTNDDYMVHTFKEKTDLYIKVNGFIRDIARKVPVDLLVDTKPMYQKFIELQSSFTKEIVSKGIVLYESKHTRVA